MRLYIVRGLPGSGKSTYARGFGRFHVEADMFHWKDGLYQFNPSRSHLGHEWCQRMVFSAMEQGLDVVVSNTFTQKWEMQPYLNLANKAEYKVTICRMNHDYGTLHGVPEEVMNKMRDRFEDIEGEILV